MERGGSARKQRGLTMGDNQMMLVIPWLTCLGANGLGFVCIGEASAGTVWFVDQDAIGTDTGTSWDDSFVDL